MVRRKPTMYGKQLPKVIQHGSTPYFFSEKRIVQKDFIVAGVITKNFFKKAQTLFFFDWKDSKRLFYTRKSLALGVSPSISTCELRSLQRSWIFRQRQRALPLTSHGEYGGWVTVGVLLVVEARQTPWPDKYRRYQKFTHSKVMVVILVFCLRFGFRVALLNK